MAWVCLIVFSVGFTAYAMAYGRSGWAQSAELQRLEVLHLRAGRDQRRMIVGVGRAYCQEYHDRKSD